ncbi:major head protein [Serratia phage JS26]|uniref:Major capsid protein n=1 Tax=Serratia phage JS26 TaxID=2315217 RepID=A0A5Q2F7P1_9CAUD|nr:major head protein [Serratia phage JS26]QGF20877.1 hypothetical protein [Serratia phage JS26]
MADVITPYGTATLLGLLRRTENIQYFWQNLYTRQINFDTAMIYLERVYRKNKKLAAFVAPNVQAGLNRLEGYTTEAVSPAYIKEKDVVDINLPFVRRPGEALITGSMTPEQRRMAWIAEFSDQHEVKIRNRWEWMSAMAAINGSITIESERYPKAVLDFGRDPGLSLTTDWTAQGANPMADIYKMRKKVNALTGGRVTTHIFGDQAWAAFYKAHKDDLKDLMDTTLRGSETAITKLVDGFEGMEYVGVIQGLNGAGRIEVWTYNTQYEDDNGDMQYFLDPGSVFGIAESLFDGVRCFGAIRDGRAGYQPIEIFPKNWVGNEDPFDEFIMHQSAPLFVPGEPNSTFLIKAVATQP